MLSDIQSTSYQLPFDNVVERTKFLLEIDETQASQSLIERYALFKVGDVHQREWFLTRLCQNITHFLGESIQENPFTWAIATPAVNEFAKEVQTILREEFNLPALATLDISREATPSSDYTDCSTVERIRIAKTFFFPIRSIAQDHILVVDDMLTSGTALRALASVVTSAGVNPQNINPFVFFRSRFSDETFERRSVDDALQSLSSSALATIVNHPRYYLTSATMLRLLCSIDKRRRDDFWNGLLPQRQELLCSHIITYYRNFELPEQLRSLITPGEALCES